MRNWQSQKEGNQTGSILDGLRGSSPDISSPRQGDPVTAGHGGTTPPLECPENLVGEARVALPGGTGCLRAHEEPAGGEGGGRDRSDENEISVFPSVHP